MSPHSLSWISNKSTPVLNTSHFGLEGINIQIMFSVIKDSLVKYKTLFIVYLNLDIIIFCISLRVDGFKFALLNFIVQPCYPLFLILLFRYLRGMFRLTLLEPLPLMQVSSFVFWFSLLYIPRIFLTAYLILNT